MITFKLIKKLFSKYFLGDNKLLKVILFAFILNILFGLLFYIFERDVQKGLSFLDAVWWVMVTMTTVGYGDFYPQTFAGRFLIAYPCMLIGIGIIGYLVGILAEVILENSSNIRKGLMSIKDTNHIIICNCPGIEKIIFLVEEFKADNRFLNSTFVLVTDRFEEIPKELSENSVKFVYGNPSRVDTLMQANLFNSSGIFILAHDPSKSDSDDKTFHIASTIDFMCEEHKKDIHTVAELVSEDNYKMVKRSKVKGIVPLNGVTDCLLIQEFLDPGSADAVKEIVSNKVGSQIYVHKTRLFQHTILTLQMKLLELGSTVSLLGIRRAGEHILNPDIDFKINEGDEIIFLARKLDDFLSVEEKIFNLSSLKD